MTNISEISVQAPNPVINERSSFFAPIYFRYEGSAIGGDAFGYYIRIDCLTTGTTILDWDGPYTPAATDVTYPIASEYNRIIDRSNNEEKKQITVAMAKDTSLEVRDNIQYIVNNRGWSD